MFCRTRLSTISQSICRLSIKPNTRFYSSIKEDKIDKSLDLIRNLGIIGGLVGGVAGASVGIGVTVNEIYHDYKMNTNYRFAEKMKMIGMMFVTSPILAVGGGLLGGTVGSLAFGALPITAPTITGYLGYKYLTQKKKLEVPPE